MAATPYLHQVARREGAGAVYEFICTKYLDKYDRNMLTLYVHPDIQLCNFWDKIYIMISQLYGHEVLGD
ncbi:hypothetical protein ANME2D_02547 [Candidatus Methanoperedens nitroreducens]|uniref:Uncharacterized protein n=1 Tax=Candidatus Methanoperedens nitratireducens TaxID=1392998 RepID=A0A062UZF3_9EURY|nr:hypothetical protein ANME2D_02547 [Candidatus Methanoperedens nitroreducens]